MYFAPSRAGVTLNTGPDRGDIRSPIIVFVDRSFLEQLAQILCFRDGEFLHPYIVQNDDVGFGELVAVAQK